MHTHDNPAINPGRKKLQKTLCIGLSAALFLVAVWFGTVWLQKPPLYPTTQMDVEKYFDDYRMDYSVSKPGLLEDMDTLVSYADEMHADPYRTTSRSAFLEKAEDLKSRIRNDAREEIPVQDAFYYLQELAAFLKDGHTSVYPLNWEKTVGLMFPLTFTTVGGRIFVKHNYGAHDVPERAEILAVNGVSMEQMAADVMKYVPATLPDYRQVGLADYLGLFIQTYYHMASPWRITYKHNGTITTATVQGIAQEQYENAAAPKQDYIESEIEAAGKTVPVLEFLGFEYGEWDDFKTFIDGFFARNQDKEYLVIDVRHHPGGNGDWGNYVLSYLTSAPLKGYKEFSFRVSPLHQQIVQYSFESAYYDMRLPQFLWSLPLYKFVEQDDPYYWIGRGILESKPGTMYYSNFEDSKSFFADENSGRFHGKVFLLTSHETFSAGVVFSELFRRNNLGVIVGRETGGRVYMESDQRPVVFPRSNLPFLIPVAKLIVGDDDPDRGVIPDITIDLTVEDYINHRDKDMEQVIDLINADPGLAI